jgi:hypothetical protein
MEHHHERWAFPFSTSVAVTATSSPGWLPVSTPVENFLLTEQVWDLPACSYPHPRVAWPEAHMDAGFERAITAEIRHL